MLIAGELDEAEELYELPEAEELIEEVSELAIRFVVGFSDPDTMKIRGLISEREIVILIDCRATHNFISKKLANELQLLRSETSNYGVIMGNGTTLRGRGVCKGVTLTIQDLTINDDFIPLELGGVDVILEMQWLKKMGYMNVDWGALTMTFQAGENQITLKGDPSLTKAEISFKMLSRVGCGKKTIKVI